MLRRIALIIFSLLLCGCAAEVPEAVTPDIKQYEVPLSSRRRVNLYFRSETDEQLITNSVELDIPQDGTAERTAVEQLLKSPGPGFRPVSGTEWACNSMHIVRDASASNTNMVAFIDISIPETSMHEIEMIKTLRKACAFTLGGMSNVNYVYMTVGGKLPEAFSNTPLESANASEAVAERRPLLVYYPDSSGKYAVPVIRMVPIAGSNADYAEAIFQEMKSSSENNALLGSNYPSEVVFGYGEDKVVMEEDGETVTIHLSGPLRVLEDRERLLMHNYCLGLTMLSVMPDLSRISIVYHPYNSAERTWSYPLGDTNSNYSSEGLNAKRGSYVPVYFAMEKNLSLNRVMRVLSFNEAANPISSIFETIKGPNRENASEAPLAPVIPPDVTSEDFMGYYIDRNTLVLNFTKEFYEKCSGLDERQELYLVYSLVNAMTDHPSIHQVLFIRNGVGVKSMSGRIILLQPLLRNPGLIRV